MCWRVAVLTAASLVGWLQEYEVCCLTRESSSKSLKGSEIKWSIWRRYSDFASLDK